MKPDYNQKPFSKLPLRLRSWFEQTIQRAETDEGFPFWRATLPVGSSSDEAIVVSHCFRTLFPERVRRERNTPVDAEFIL